MAFSNSCMCNFLQLFHLAYVLLLSMSCSCQTVYTHNLTTIFKDAHAQAYGTVGVCMCAGLCVYCADSIFVVTSNKPLVNTLVFQFDLKDLSLTYDHSL